MLLREGGSVLDMVSSVFVVIGGLESDGSEAGSSLISSDTPSVIMASSRISGHLGMSVKPPELHDSRCEHLMDCF